jgi:phage terminase Nu1 subunit (DNA packaging protein)
MNNVFDINADLESFTSPTAKLIWAKTKLAIHKATLAEIETKAKTGELVPVSLVRQQADRAGRTTRDWIMALPERVAATLVGRSEKQILAELRRECRDLLSNCAAEFEQPETGKS